MVFTGDKKQIDFYNFYKSPDGHDCLEKTYHSTKYCGIFGAVFSVYEMVLITKPTTIRACIARFGRFTLPFAGMGAVFGSSVCILGQLRGKSDFYNHTLAGMLAGTVWGAKYQRVHHGHLAAVFFGFLAGYMKYFDDNDIPMFRWRTPEMQHNYPNMDFTIKIYDDPGRPDEA